MVRRYHQHATGQIARLGSLSGIHSASVAAVDVVNFRPNAQLSQQDFIITFGFSSKHSAHIIRSPLQCIWQLGKCQYMVSAASAATGRG